MSRKKKATVTEEETPFSAKKSKVTEWSSDELNGLIENIKLLLPKEDNMKYNTRMKKLNWEEVKFGQRSTKQCKEKWKEVTTKLRRFRTLSELIVDAEEWALHPWRSSLSKKNKSHPDMPKKPLTPYFRYFLAKRQKFSRAHPGLSMTDLAKLIAPKYKSLSDKKKAKYQEVYKAEMEDYKRKFEDFKAEHPEFFLSTKKGADILKPQTPFQIFKGSKMAKSEDVTGGDKPVLLQNIKTHWLNLSDGKRMKWIRRAVTDQARYDDEVEKYIVDHPDYKVPVLRAALTKAERELKEKFDGKPDRPPNTGYGLFSKVMLKELREVPGPEKMFEISRRWKQLSEEERNSYNVQAAELTEAYKEQFQSYLSTLTPSERERVRVDPKKPKPRSKLAGVKEVVEERENDKRQTTPEFFYQLEKLPEYELTYPSFSKPELIKRITMEFLSLPEEKKKRYHKMSKMAMERNVKNKIQKQSKILFKNEPKKPPASAYSLFSTEKLRTLTTIEPQKRMAEIAKRWKRLDDEERTEYKNRYEEMKVAYTQEYGRFLASLTPEEMLSFKSMKEKPQRKPKRTKKGEEKESKEDSASSSSSSSSSDEESSSSSSSDDSDDEDDDDMESSSSDSSSSGDDSSEDTSSQLESSGSESNENKAPPTSKKEKK